MDEKTQKERLEQELRFLKESLEAEVISKEEFEKGRERIEKKLHEIGHPIAKIEEEDPKKDEETGNTEEAKPKEPEKSAEAKAAPEKIEPINEEKIQLNVLQDDEFFEEAHTENQDVYQIHEPGHKKDKKNGAMFFKYGALIIILALVAFLSYAIINSNEPSNETKLVAACNSNNDCQKDGQTGTCANPGLKDAKCEFAADERIKVTVLNDRKDCFNCDPQRVLNILQSWFGDLNANEIDYNSNEGKKIADEFDFKLLPAYILEESTAQKPAFEQYKQVFVKKSSSYVLTDDAAASVLYASRQNTPATLDLFVIAGDASTARAEKNLKEFLDAFPNVKFEKHFSADNITKELGIRSFPTFLINSRNKFSGAQPADIIKNNFCSLNKVAECSKTLTKSLV